MYLHKTALIYNLAQCYRRLGDLTSAIAAYERLLAIDGKMPEYHMELARCLIDAERIDEAIAELETAHRLDPAIPEAASLLGFALLQRDDLGTSERWYREAWKLAGDRADVAYDLAYVLCSEKPGRRPWRSSQAPRSLMHRPRCARTSTPSRPRHMSASRTVGKPYEFSPPRWRRFPAVRNCCRTGS